MAEKLKRSSNGIRDVATTWGSATLLVLASFALAYQFVGPAPPKNIVMATGEDGGAYQHYGELFAAYLANEGVQVELRATAGSVENIALLNGDAGVDVGFVQGGLAGSVPAENVVAIGSLYLEPFWAFAQTDAGIEKLADLTGKRIAVGAPGSGTRAVTLQVLDAHGIVSGNAEFLDVPADDLADAFSNDEIDVAFIIAAAESDYIGELINLPNVRLNSLGRADAYVRRYSFVSKVSLPQGVLDLRSNQPPSNITTVALAAMLATKEDLHPALISLLLTAATHIHGQHSMLADVGEFPTPRYTDLPLSDDAERYFRQGPPFLMRYLPFWAATLVDRLWIMLLPMIGLAIPLMKLVPPAYRWQIRRRLLRLYRELEQIDPSANSIRDDEDLAARLDRLEHLDSESVIGSVPKGYTDDVYKLRRDIDLVRRRLSIAITPNL
jgi:TRAP transporter TAXI family solute receptor